MAVRDVLLAAALFAVLAVAVLLATGGWIAALEAHRAKGRVPGELSGWISFAVVHTVTAAWAWHALAFDVRPFG